MIVFLLATLQAESTPHIWLIVTGSLGTLFVAVILSSFFVGRFFPKNRGRHQEQISEAPPPGKTSAVFVPSTSGGSQQPPRHSGEVPQGHRSEEAPSAK